VYRPDHPLARRSRIGLRDLLGFPLVLMAKGSRARSRVERVFREEVAGREPDLSMDTTNALMILEFVKMGLGVGIGSFVTEVAPRWRLETRDLSRLFGRERVVIVRRRDDEPDAVTDAFRRILGEHLRARGRGP
jgi:LysR family cys regulon transcriptional activator